MGAGARASGQQAAATSSQPKHTARHEQTHNTQTFEGTWQRQNGAHWKQATHWTGHTGLATWANMIPSGLCTPIRFDAADHSSADERRRMMAHEQGNETASQHETHCDKDTKLEEAASETPQRARTQSAPR